MNSLLLKSQFKTLVMCFSTQSRNHRPTSSHFWPSETARKIPHSRLKHPPFALIVPVRDTADTDTEVSGLIHSALLINKCLGWSP